ncbi:hypothetical protein CMQ_475 [Grosmannia clavigera kw1407]|uniref:Uncharacterized protein n=1 Tax=Grosmannia clavigera (strain kw1407 / UAMH 11150) TaxID=655863 RepID=F0XDZ3_GROCL|nr:uncharacterized protein CMQ_475 [Grosmannia clavigera kw1407]EFX03547.1 hypothetical protein CMQ_475 [Grosmannia clavigera kw1407]
MILREDPEDEDSSDEGNLPKAPRTRTNEPICTSETVSPSAPAATTAMFWMTPTTCGGRPQCRYSLHHDLLLQRLRAALRAWRHKFAGDDD